MAVTLVANLRPFGRSRNSEHSRKYRVISRLGKADLELTSSPLVIDRWQMFARWLSYAARRAVHTKQGDAEPAPIALMLQLDSHRKIRVQPYYFPLSATMDAIKPKP